MAMLAGNTESLMSRGDLLLLKRMLLLNRVNKLYTINSSYMKYLGHQRSPKRDI